MEHNAPPPLPKSLTLTAEARFDLEAAQGDAGKTLPRFRMVAYTGVPMRIAGWRFPVVVDLAGLNIPSQTRPIRFGHDAASGVGHSDSIRIEGGQLIATGLVSRDTPAAREVVASSKNGFPWQASIGSSVEEVQFIKAGKDVMVNGQSFAGPLNVVRKSTLGEISFVDLGADGQTRANVAAQAPGTPTQTNSNHPQETDVMNDATQTDTTTAPGSSPNTPPGPPVSPAPGNGKVANVQAPPEVVGNTAPNPPADSQTVEDIRAQALAETQRITEVRRLCGDGKFPQVQAQAISEGWDATRTELEVLRASRPKAPMIQTHNSNSELGSGNVLEAACLLTAKLGDVEKLYDERTLDAASKRYRGGIGLQELLLEAAWANGYTGRNFRDPRNVLRYAFGTQNGPGGYAGVEAAFSTIDVSGILSNVANKFLLDGFFSVERTWRNITAVRNVSDFKTVTSYRLIGKDQYETVAPGGELKHGTLGEEQYSNKADTYGLMLSIDRRDVINDDLGSITTVPRKLGRGSGLKINDVFWTTFLNNAAFFTAGGNNFIAGAGTALSIDGLTQGETAFMDQVDSDGKPIGIMPSVVLVPTALSAIGTQLNKSLELRDTTSNTKYPVSNPHQGKFRVEVSRYLSNSQYTGNSAKAWYLLADPTDLPVIETAFLNGQESPTIETAEADFNVLGVQMRGYHDFGVALQDPRGGVKAKGEV